MMSNRVEVVVRISTFSLILLTSIAYICKCDSCPATTPTVKIVESCPKTEGEWRAASSRKKCNQMADYKGCGKTLVYHCLLNQWGNETLEVCAPPWFISGFCAMFNTDEERVIDNFNIDCSKFTTGGCPTRYLSSDAYKYQKCYGKHSVSPSTSSTKGYKVTYSSNDRLSLIIPLVLMSIAVLVLSVLLALTCKGKLGIGEKETVIIDEDEEGRISEKNEIADGDEEGGMSEKQRLLLEKSQDPERETTDTRNNDKSKTSDIEKDDLTEQRSIDENNITGYNAGSKSLSCMKQPSENGGDLASTNTGRSSQIESSDKEEGELNVTTTTQIGSEDGTTNLEAKQLYGYDETQKRGTSDVSEKNIPAASEDNDNGAMNSSPTQDPSDVLKGMPNEDDHQQSSDEYEKKGVAILRQKFEQ